MAFLLAIPAALGVAYLANEAYEKVVVPVGVKIGNGIDHVKDIPNKIKRKHELAELQKLREERTAIVEEIKKRNKARQFCLKAVI